MTNLKLLSSYSEIASLLTWNPLMDSKLKAYLEKKFKDLASKKDLKILRDEIKALDKKIEDRISDNIEVIRNVNENISDQINKIDLAHSYLRQHVDHVFKRIDYLEKKLLK